MADEILTAQEAASYLKMDLTALYKALKAGRIPGGKIAGQWRLSKAKLDAIIRGECSSSGNSVTG